MKLELKHLAPYLPYGLKIRVSRSGNIQGLESLSVNAGLMLFKPILRPLSDLTNGDFELGIIKTSSNEVLFSVDGYRYTVEGLRYCWWIKLVENHYDVFGLIEKGLAIDINTLNK